MPLARPLAILLATAVCALAAAPPALAQSGGGAGDQQYQDPFGGQTKTTPSKTKSKGSNGSNGLSSTPNLGSSSGTAGTSTSSSAPTTTTTAPAGGSSVLPRTGEDVWIVALAGVALLLAGLGLRVRAADDGR